MDMASRESFLLTYPAEPQGSLDPEPQKQCHQIAVSALPSFFLLFPQKCLTVGNFSLRWILSTWWPQQLLHLSSSQFLGVSLTGMIWILTLPTVARR